MSDYLKQNHDFWQQGYNAPNPESAIFRLNGRILKSRFGLPKENTRLLDFGCGQGAHVNFFIQQGYNARGVDISEKDLAIAKCRYPQLSDRFQLVSSDPSKVDKYGWTEGIDVVTAQQTLYYFSDEHLAVALRRLYDSMSPGALIYASMMGTEHTYYAYSEPSSEPSLRRVTFSGSRFNLDNYYVNFIESAAEIEEKFGIFKKLEVGKYMLQFEENESNNFHWVFIGQKST